MSARCLLFPDSPTLLPDSPMLYPDGWDCSDIDYGPGGGGHGAVMSDAFFQRYTPRYEASYKQRYQPTIRKQKA